MVPGDVFESEDDSDNDFDKDDDEDVGMYDDGNVRRGSKHRTRRISSKRVLMLPL